MEIANLEILLGIDMSEFTSGVDQANGFARSATAQIQGGFERMARGVEGAVKAADAAIDGIVASVDSARRGATVGLNQLVTSASAVLAGGIQKVVDSVKVQLNRMSGIVDSVKGSFIASLDRLVVSARTIVNDFVAIGRDIVAGLIAGLKASIGSSVEAVRSWVSGLAQTARNALGIKSPSRVFYDLAGNVVWGFRDGIRDNGGQASEAIEKWLLDMVEKANRQIRLDTMFRIQASKLRLEAREIELSSETWTVGRGPLNLNLENLFGSAAGGAAGALRGVLSPGKLQDIPADEPFLDVWRKGLDDFALGPVEVMRELGGIIEKAPERFAAALQGGVEGLALKDVGLPDSSFPIVPTMLNDEVATRLMTAFEEVPLNIDLEALPLVLDSSFKLDESVLDGPVQGAALAWVDVIEDIGPGLADLSLQAFEPPIMLWGNVLNEGVEGFQPALQGLVNEVDDASLSFVDQIAAFEPPLILWGNVLEAALEPTKELAQRGIPGLLEAVEAVPPVIDEVLGKILQEDSGPLPQISFSPQPGQTDINGKLLSGGTPGWLEFLLAPLKEFASLLDILNPVASLVAGAMEVLKPVVETLAVPLTILGNILAAAIVPILKLLFPVLKIAAIAVAGFALVILEVWNAIAGLIRIITFGLVDLRADTGALYKGIADLVGLTWEEAEARKRNTDSLNAATEVLNNVPDIFKIERARFAATQPAPALGGVGLMPIGGPRTADPIAGQHVSVTIVSSNPEEIWRKLEPYLRRKNFNSSGSIV